MGYKQNIKQEQKGIFLLISNFNTNQKHQIFAAEYTHPEKWQTLVLHLHSVPCRWGIVGLEDFSSTILGL